MPEAKYGLLCVPEFDHLPRVLHRYCPGVFVAKNDAAKMLGYEKWDKAKTTIWPGFKYFFEELDVRHLIRKPESALLG